MRVFYWECMKFETNKEVAWRPFVGRVCDGKVKDGFVLGDTPLGLLLVVFWV